METIFAHEQALIAYALERLAEIPQLQVFGPAAEHKGGVASFTMEGIHPHDIAQILDGEGIPCAPVIIAHNPCMRSSVFPRPRVPAFIFIIQRKKWMRWWREFIK